MPILLPSGLPAADTLRTEGIAVSEAPEAPADALRIALVNLMPDKPAAERQFARLLGAAAETVSLSLVHPAEARGSRTPAEHLAAFYGPLPRAAAGLDGLIVTGAPVETLPFPEVRYWDALGALLDDAASRRVPVLGICWAGMALLYRFHGVPKHVLGRKAFGVFPQAVARRDVPLMQGLSPRYPVPVSRHAAVIAEDLAGTGAVLLAASPSTGLSIAEDAGRAQTMLLDHFEYEGDTLLAEFLRDRAAALPASPPANLPLASVREPPWRAAAHVFFRNWLATVARAKRERTPRDLLSWLLAGAAPSEPGAMLVLRARGSVDLHAATAQAARCGVTLEGAFGDRALGAVVLRLCAGARPEAVERLAKACIALPGVNDVLLRGPGEAGAILHRAA